MIYFQEGEESDIYASIQELRDESDALSVQINQLEESGDRERASIERLRLEEIQERLLAKHKERNSRK